MSPVASQPPRRGAAPGRGGGQQLGADDAGQRVVVRYRLADGRATDVLGDLVSADEHGLVVRRDVGAEPVGAFVTVPVADVIASRVVPPRAVRRPRQVPPSGHPD